MDLDFDKLEDFPVVTRRGWALKEEYFQYIQRRNVITNTGESQINVCEWDILASCSPVLEAWARWEPKIKCSGNQALSSFSNDEDAIKQLTEYMQGRRIKVTKEDLYELLCLADMLQVDDVSNYCKHRLASLELNKDNYHKILNACSVYSFQHEKMDLFIRGNLTELCKESGILTISPDTVEWLLTDEELSYWPMDDRFVFITDWCNVRECRTVYFEKWFDHLDFDKIDKDIIQVVVKNENLVRRSAKCLNKVNVHLRDRKDTPVPFVFTLNDMRTGSNTIGFNMEDKHLYKFKFPDRTMKSTSVTTV
ncbi:uncharacterized protein LOC123562812 [Mercenaria mercenaria]|uniref:uncharacterized protein LOC123562812 n=1 Tax=Mercenaria mercenaria TaxID=6596 RepID=UPI00234F3197|nr:uncharacterized protein LOC123562812 [Mercenaria mercenaria]